MPYSGAYRRHVHQIEQNWGRYRGLERIRSTWRQCVRRYGFAASLALQQALRWCGSLQPSRCRRRGAEPGGTGCQPRLLLLLHPRWCRSRCAACSIRCNLCTSSSGGGGCKCRGIGRQGCGNADWADHRSSGQARCLPASRAGSDGCEGGGEGSSARCHEVGTLQAPAPAAYHRAHAVPSHSQRLGARAGFGTLAFQCYSSKIHLQAKSGLEADRPHVCVDRQSRAPEKSKVGLSSVLESWAENTS